MAGNLITVTDVGRAALVAPGNAGTLAHKVIEIGLASAPFVVDKGLKALPNERKRIATIAGANVAPDTIHVTLKDDTADQYTLYGFGLYLENGVLAAVYGQATPIMEKSPEAMLLLSTDVQFTTIDAANLVFGDASFTNPPATTTVQGVVRLATNPEAIAGTDTKTAVTPAGLQAAIGPAIAGKSDKGHRHAIVDVDGLQAVLDGKSAVGHKHVIADVTGLQSSLDDKFPLSGGIVWGATRLKGTGTYSPSLILDANGYAPYLRSNSVGQCIEAVNSASTAINMSLSDGGVLNLPRARPTWAGTTPWDSGNLDPLTKSGGSLNINAPLSLSPTIGNTAFRIASPDGNGIGGAWVDWNVARTPALQIDAPNALAAYMGMRWTRWGGRHFAAIEAFEGGSITSEPSIVMQIDGRQNAWTFGRNEIARGAGGGTVFGTWNLDPVRARNATATRGYVVSDGDATVTLNWDNASNTNLHVNGYYQGALLTHQNFSNWAAPAGATCQWATGTQNFGGMASGALLPAPWVMCGAIGPGNGTANAIAMYGVQLRNR